MVDLVQRSFFKPHHKLHQVRIWVVTDLCWQMHEWQVTSKLKQWFFFYFLLSVFLVFFTVSQNFLHQATVLRHSDGFRSLQLQALVCTDNFKNDFDLVCRSAASVRWQNSFLKVGRYLPAVLPSRQLATRRYCCIYQLTHWLIVFDSTTMAIHICFPCGKTVTSEKLH